MFPLPTSRDKLAALCPDSTSEALSWLVCVVLSLNSLWGDDLFYDGIISECQAGCIRNLEFELGRFLKMELTFEEFFWGKFFQTRSIDYQGEEVKIAKSFQWENISPALPKEIGRVPLREICEHGAKHYVENIDLYLKPRTSWPKLTTPKVMVEDCHWPKVCSQGCFRREYAGS